MVSTGLTASVLYLPIQEQCHDFSSMKKHTVLHGEKPRILRTARAKLTGKGGHDHALRKSSCNYSARECAQMHLRKLTLTCAQRYGIDGWILCSREMSQLRMS